MSEDRRPAVLCAAAVAALAAGLYAATCAPTVTFGGDCGELAAAVHTWGVPHPTGYPLYLLLGKLVTLLAPLGTVGWRVSLASALCGAAAVGLVTWQVARTTRDLPAAWLAGTSLLFAAAFWSQAVIAEVYALHVLLLALLLALHVEWHESGDLRWLNLVGLTYGLGLCHHASTLLFVPATLLSLALGRHRVGLVGVSLRLAGWAAPVLLLYAYLPLRSGLEPPLDWGRTSSLPNFLAHVTGRSYRGLLGDATPGAMLRFAGNHLVLLGLDLRYAAVLAVVGLVGLRARRELLGLLGLAALTTFGFAVAYRVGDRGNYVLPVYLIAAISAGHGAAWVRRRCCRGPQQATAGVLLTAVVVLLPLLPAPPDGAAAARYGFDRSTMAGNQRARQLADAVLDEVPAGGALLVLSDELAWACWYEQVVEGRRRDVTVHPLGDLSTPREIANLDRILAAELPARDTCAAFWHPLLAARCRLLPQAVTCRLARPGEAPLADFGEPVARPPAPLPAAPSWGLVSARLTSPVQIPVATAEGPRPWPALKPRTWLALDTQVGCRQSPAAAVDAVVVLVHESLAAPGPTAPRVLNDSTGQVRRWEVLRVPFGPTADGYEPAPGRAVRERFPVALPARVLAGRYEVRWGLIPRQDEALRRRLSADLGAARAATVPVAWVVTWQR